MFYALRTENHYLHTAYNATSSFEVREKLFELLKATTDLTDEELIELAKESLEDIAATRGWVLEKSKTKFTSFYKH